MADEDYVDLFLTLDTYKKKYDGKKSLKQYIPIVDCIINVGDLDVITVSKILKSLSDLYGDDGLSNNQDLKELIYERFYFYQKCFEKNKKGKLSRKKEKKRKRDVVDENPEKELELKPKKKKENKEEERILVKTEADEKLTASKNKKSKIEKVVNEKKNVNSESAKPKKTKKGGFALTPVEITSELANLIGENQPLTKDPWTRTKVTQAVWSYIKEHNLQNPEDKREILFKNDPLLCAIFPDDASTVTMFSMQKYISANLNIKKNSE